MSIINVIKDILGLIGLGSIIWLLVKTVKTFTATKEIKKLETSYQRAFKFAKENLPEIRGLLNKLPEEIIVETTYDGDKVFISKFRTSFKKSFKKLVGKQPLHIVIFKDMSYPQQIAFIIKEVFKSIMPFEKVLGIDLRDALISYYSYKFALSSEEIVEREVINLLERDFQEKDFKKLILRLDSVELEETIALNPPPEIRALLNRVIIPIIELKSMELADIRDISQIETVKHEMQQILTKIADGRIGILFVGIKKPDEYIQYVENRITEFDGILCCSRGRHIKIHDAIHNEICKIIKEKFSKQNIKILNFEGKLGNGKPVTHKYTLILF